jgi:lipopolysaccharide export system protein LptA
MNRSRRSLISSVLRMLAAPAMGAVVLLFAAPLGAQTLTNSFGGLSQSSNDPIDIESDVLVVQDKQKLATFKGNVKAVQGATTLRAEELNVHYVGGDRLAPGGKNEGESQTSSAPDGNAQAGAGAKPEDKSNAQITKIEAKGDVVITSEDDQTTTSEWALYDLPAQLVTVGGNVVLTQGKNVLKGDRLVIDLKTGESRFENTGNAAAGGRIRALFMPKKDGKDAKSGNAKASAAQAEGEASPEPRNGTPDAAGAPVETPAAGEPDDVPWPITPGMQP